MCLKEFQEYCAKHEENSIIGPGVQGVLRRHQDLVDGIYEEPGTVGVRDVAARFAEVPLVRRGSICRYGSIDLVFFDSSDEVYLVEVKIRKTPSAREIARKQLRKQFDYVKGKFGLEAVRVKALGLDTGGLFVSFTHPFSQIHSSIAERRKWRDDRAI